MLLPPLPLRLLPPGTTSCRVGFTPAEDAHLCTAHSFLTTRRRDVILMNRQEVRRLGLRVDQRLTIRSASGTMRDILVREYDIRASNALMYFPEANALVPTTVDPLSRIPAFKSVLVTVETDVSTDRRGPVADDKASQENCVGSRVELEVVRDA